MTIFSNATPLLDPPDRTDYMQRYRTALGELRSRHPELANARYLEEDAAAAAERFRKSKEFEATVDLLLRYGASSYARLVELGAGNGIASLAFASRGFKVTAVEPCSEQDYGVPIIRRLSAAMNLPVTAVVSWGECLPFADEAFDVVYLRQCLHHAFDLREMVAESARVLKRGGLFLATREHIVSGERELQRFLEWHPMVHYGLPEHAYTKNEYVEALRQAGLRPLRVLGPHSFPINLDRESIQLAVTRLQARMISGAGAGVAALLATAAEKVLAWGIAGRFLNAVRHPMGRLSSFLARKK